MFALNKFRTLVCVLGLASSSGVARADSLISIGLVGDVLTSTATSQPTLTVGVSLLANLGLGTQQASNCSTQPAQQSSTSPTVNLDLDLTASLNLEKYINGSTCPIDTCKPNYDCKDYPCIDPVPTPSCGSKPCFGAPIGINCIIPNLYDPCPTNCPSDPGSPSPHSTAVPAPGSLTLIAIGGVFLLGGRFRRESAKLVLVTSDEARR